MPKLRPFPFPYRAAFSISNDSDLTTPERYLFLRDMFRQFPAAKAGAACGFPFSDSFFVFNENRFHPEQITLASNPEILMPDLESGYLTTLHGWGDFNFNPIFERRYAVEGMGLLKESRARLRVWTNHGTLHNLQNIGPGLGYGDLREYRDGASLSYPMVSYHADILRELGIRYYWTSGLSQVVGQNRPLDTSSYYRAYYRLTEAHNLKQKALSLAKRLFYLPVRVRLQANSVLEEMKLQDGPMGFQFIRYGRFDCSTADDIMEIAGTEVIDELLARQGVMVLFTHLGKTRTKPDELCPGTLQSLQYLKLKYDEKSLWICPLEKLLEYCELIKTIIVRYKDPVIDLDKVSGTFSLTPEKLRGLTLYCKKAAVKVRILSTGQFLKYIVNPADSNGRKSLTLTGEVDESPANNKIEKNEYVDFSGCIVKSNSVR